MRDLEERNELPAPGITDGFPSKSACFEAGGAQQALGRQSTPNLQRVEEGREVQRVLWAGGDCSTWGARLENPEFGTNEAQV